MSTYDRGSPVLIEVDIKKQVPFGALDYFDPVEAKITITDPLGTVKVNANDMIKSETGKYYFICQTDVAWATGNYSGKVAVRDATYNDITINRQAFRLR